MQLLYASPSFGFGHTLRIALEGEGIRAFCSDADNAVAGLGGPMAGLKTRVYVATDDYARAVDVLERMLSEDVAEPEAEPAPAVAAMQRQVPMWAVMVVVSVAIAAVGAILGH